MRQDDRNDERLPSEEVQSSPRRGRQHLVEVIANESAGVVRRYSADGHILGGELVGTLDEDAFQHAFDDPAVALVHVRAVEYGCFLYEVRGT